MADIEVIRKEVAKRTAGADIESVIDHIITECAISGVDLSSADGRAIMRDLLWEAAATWTARVEALTAALGHIAGWTPGYTYKRSPEFVRGLKQAAGAYKKLAREALKETCDGRR